jgi:hypothetical protein
MAGTVRAGAGLSTDLQKSQPCLSFDFHSAIVGCEYGNSRTCEFNLTGLRYDPESRKEMAVASSFFNLIACESLHNCQMQEVTVEGFRNISAIVLRATAGGKERSWWANDLSLGWSNNTCESASCRARLLETASNTGPLMTVDDEE